MPRAARALQASMALQVEVELDGVGDVRVDDRACGHVPALVRVAGVLGEQSHVVALWKESEREVEKVW